MVRSGDRIRCRFAVRPDRDGTRPAESAPCGLGDGRSGVSLHWMGAVPPGPAYSLAAHVHRQAGLSTGRVGRPVGPESSAGGSAQAAVTAAAGAISVFRPRGGALVCFAVFLRVQDLPSDPGYEPAGNRAVQPVLFACAAAELPLHGALLADQSLAAAGGIAGVFSTTKGVELSHPTKGRLGGAPRLAWDSHQSGGS